MVVYDRLVYRLIHSSTFYLLSLLYAYTSIGIGGIEIRRLIRMDESLDRLIAIAYSLVNG